MFLLNPNPFVPFENEQKPNTNKMKQKHIDIYLCIAYNDYIDDNQCEVLEMKEMDIALICKALGDSNRLKIVKMLSDGEKCTFAFWGILRDVLQWSIHIVRIC